MLRGLAKVFFVGALYVGLWALKQFLDIDNIAYYLHWDVVERFYEVPFEFDARYYSAINYSIVLTFITFVFALLDSENGLFKKILHTIFCFGLFTGLFILLEFMEIDLVTYIQGAKK